jgi:hypothetical protein
MAATSVSPTKDLASAGVHRISRTGLATSGPFVGIATISAVQAWEWLFSGLTKLQNASFVNGFLGFVSHAPGPYGGFMTVLASRFPTILPKLVEATELGLGLSLIAAATLVLAGTGRLRRLSILAAGGASLVGFATASNIAILAHNRAPWTIGMAPFTTGVPVESLLAAISLAGVATAYSAWRVAKQ